LRATRRAALTARRDAGAVFTLSNVATTTGDIATNDGSTIHLQVIATTTDAAGRVYASDGTPLGDISGAIGAINNVPILTGSSPIHIDWSGVSPGSITFRMS